MSEYTCKLCGVELENRANPATFEQRWCGEWYDHPVKAGSMIGHTFTLLVPSQALIEQTTEMTR